MAKQNKKTLKGYFETGDVPNQTQYQHLIDSQLNLSETGTQILVGTLSSSFLEVENHITASGNISASGNIITTNITSSGNISSSGIITADTLTSNNIVFTPGATSIKIEAPDETSGNIDGAALTIESGNGFGSNQNGGNITLQTGKGSGAGDGGDIIINAGGGFPSGSISLNSTKININGPVTASGDISSSGTVTATDMTTVGRHYFNAFGGSNSFLIKSGDNLLIDNAGLIVSSHITASGNISASGNILANNATIVEQLDMTSANNAVLNMYQQSSLNTSLQSRGSLNSFIEAGNSTANLGVGTSTPAEKLTVHGNISGSGNLKVDGSQVDFTNLPTSDPNIAGRLFRDGTDLKISVG